jgi:stage II sporulation protein D
VAATAGQVLTYAGRPAITYFFASSGGRTESVENAFAGSLPAPWLRGVSDPYDAGPLHSWTLTLSFPAAAARLGGLVRGRFTGIEVLRRGVSPRVLSACVLGSGGRTLVSGAQLAARLGLYDTWAYFSVRDGSSLSAEPDRSGTAPAGSVEGPGGPVSKGPGASEGTAGSSPEAPAAPAAEDPASHAGGRSGGTAAPA